MIRKEESRKGGLENIPEQTMEESAILTGGDLSAWKLGGTNKTILYVGQKLRTCRDRDIVADLFLREAGKNDDGMVSYNTLLDRLKYLGVLLNSIE